MSFPASFQFAEGDSDDSPDSKLDADAEAYIRGPLAPAYFRSLTAAVRKALSGDLAALVEMRKKDLDSPILPGVGHSRGTVDGPGGPIPTLTLWPDAAEPSSLPRLMFIHGGGWGRRTFHAWNIRLSRLVLRHKFEVTSFAYSLSPEAPVGRALDECYAILHSLPNDRPIVVAGDSAGANMAVSMAARLQQEENPARKIAGLILWYPPLDVLHPEKYSTWDKYADGFGLNANLAKLFDKVYVPDEKERGHWRFCPMFADVSAFPPTLIIGAQFDVAREQGLVFAKKLADAGRSVRYRCVPGTIHAFMSLWFERPVAISNEEIEAFLRNLSNASSQNS
jgi:acetyl esterase/lipase